MERLISPKTAEEHAVWVFLAGGVMSTISAIVAYFVFAGSTFEKAIGIFIPFFVTIGAYPLMINLSRYDEAQDENLLKAKRKVGIFRRHQTVIKVYIAFFLGVIISLLILYMMLPKDAVDKIFGYQMDEISRIRGAVTMPDIFSKIFRNNVQVLVLSFLLSFIFGAGAVFIISWNSSVLAAAIGASAENLGGVAGVPQALMQYFPHGSLEFLAYFVGAIAGSIVSVAVTRRKHDYFWQVIEDGAKIMMLGVILLAVAAFIESLSILRI